MIAGLKPYPEYKDSELPWLGQVPGHWSVRRIKTILRELDSRSTDGDGTLLSLTRGRGLIPYADRTEKLHSAKTLVGYKQYKPAQIVMNRMQAWSGMFGAGQIAGLVSPDYAVFEILGGHHTRLVLERLKAPDLVGQFALESKGIGSGFNRLYTDRFGPIPITLPPPSEQAAIVRFLDWATGRLERAIRAKRKVIALLNEQKQAIIHRAVTRGFDSSVSLSGDSRPFLEQLPTHWPVFRAKLLFRQVVPSIPDDAEIVTCFRDGQVTLRRNRRTTGFTNAIWELGYQGIEPGQLVLHSMDAFAGAIGVSDSRGKCSPEYVICEPAMDGVLPEYYAHLLRSLALRGLFVALCPSVRERAPRVRFSDFGAFVLPKPMVSEQLEIAGYIRKACRKIDTSLEAVRREADLLRDYRTRLVADVVTGKLDVREAAARLPDEALLDSMEDDAELSDETEAADEEEAAV